MISPTVYATILFLAIVTAGMVLGFAAAVMAFGARLPAIKHKEYMRGLMDGRGIARRTAAWDVPASDATAAFPRRSA